jgi:hypothetical protein
MRPSYPARAVLLRLREPTRCARDVLFFRSRENKNLFYIARISKKTRRTRGRPFFAQNRTWRIPHAHFTRVAAGHAFASRHSHQDQSRGEVRCGDRAGEAIRPAAETKSRRRRGSRTARTEASRRSAYERGVGFVFARDARTLGRGGTRGRARGRAAGAHDRFRAHETDSRTGSGEETSRG